jgi:Ala-tRNA(Pro) deacylase
MSISATVRNALERSGTAYELVPHERTFTSMETAEAAHVAGEKLAKSVVVSGDDGHMMVVIPSTHHVRFGALSERFGQPFTLAAESDVKQLFTDCDVGSVPPLGQAYGVRVLVDDTLLEQEDVYFEAGDHEELVHVAGEDFRKLMAGAEHGPFARHV